MPGPAGTVSDDTARDSGFEDRAQDVPVTPVPPSPSKKSNRKSYAPGNSPQIIGKSRRSNSDDVVLRTSSNVFINLRLNPSSLSALSGKLDSSGIALCQSVILESLFPDDGSIETDLQLSRLLGQFIFLEVAACKDLETLLRDNSLSALLASSYCKRKSAQTFLLENLNPILRDTVLDPNIHGEDAERIELMQQLLQRIVSVVCAKVHSLPIGLAFISENIYAGMKAHAYTDNDSQDAREHIAACAVGSIVFLRFIVPHIAMHYQANPSNLPSSEHAAVQIFFVEAASCLMKMSNGTIFPPTHKLNVVNQTVKDLTSSVQSAFFRISTEIAIERVSTESVLKPVLSSTIQVDALVKFMKLLVSVKDSIVLQVDAADVDTSSNQAIFAAVDEFASLSEHEIATSNCVKAGGTVQVPLTLFSIDSVLSNLMPPAMSISTVASKEHHFSVKQLEVIEEAAMIVQDSISGRSFDSNRIASSRSSFIAPIALRMTRSIIFQRFILVLCLLHCFMAAYETRAFKSYKTREKCLESTPDAAALTNIFASESVIIAFYWAFFCAKVYTRSGKIGGWSLVQLFVTAVLSIDLLYNWLNQSLNGGSLIRFATPLRPVMQIVRTTQIAHALRRHLHELYSTIMSAKYMFAIIIVYCLIVGIIMNIVVRTVCAGCDSVGCLVPSDDGSDRVSMCAMFNTRFSTTGNSVLTAFVLITASNYNSISEMLLAYMDQTQDKGRALIFFLFLMLVVLVGYFLLLPLLLAVVVSSFRKARLKSVDQDNASKQNALTSAFALLLSIEGSDVTISERVYFSFMRAVNLHFSDKEIALFFQYLDTDLSKTLSIDEFTQLLDILSLSLRQGFRKRISHYFIHLGPIGKGLISVRKLFQHRRCRIFISLIIIANVAVYIWMGYIPSGIRASDSAIVNGSSYINHVVFSYDCVSDKYASSCRQAQIAEIIDFLLFLIYCIELLLSFFSYGLSSLFMPWIMFNLGLISFSSVFYVLAYLGFGVSPIYVSVFRFVNLVRVLRLFELSVNFKALMQSIRGSLRGFSSFIVFSVSTVFSWAFIALLMLQCNQVGGSFNPDNLKNGTPVNFDSLTGSVLSLFQITVVDDWDDFIWSAQSSNSPALGAFYSVYFLAFFLILVLVITNVLTSSIIEAYDEQVQLEEKKLNTESHSTGSVFIDGVEFVKVGSTLSRPKRKSLAGSKNNLRVGSNQLKNSLPPVPKLLRKAAAISSELSSTKTHKASTVMFDDSLEMFSLDKTIPSPPGDMMASEESDFVSGPLRHPSLMVKGGFLNMLKISTGKLSSRWCSLNTAKFRLFSRSNHLNLKLNIIIASLERVDNHYDSQVDISFPIVLHRNRKHGSTPIVLSAPSFEDQEDWITVNSHPSLMRSLTHELHHYSRVPQLFNEILAYHRSRLVEPTEPEKTWREYASNSSKEGGKVLTQLIDALLNPTEDVPRYILVLQQFCWLADELGESEIVCPIVEYAEQLIPQLQHSMRNSKISMRGESGGLSDSGSGSDPESVNGDYRTDSAANGAGSSRKLAWPSLPRLPVPQRDANSLGGSPKLNFSAVMKAVEVHNSQVQEAKRLSAVVPDNPPGSMQDPSRKQGTKAAALAVMAAKFFQQAGDAHNSNRISDMVIESMKRDLAQESRFESDAPEFELHEVHRSAVAPVVAAGDVNLNVEIEEIFAGLATKNAVPSSASSPSRHSNSSSHSQPLTRSQPISPRLQRQQEEAMAELHAALSTALKPSSVSAQRLTVAENWEQHNKQQLQHNHQQQQLQSRQQHPQNPEEATATHVQPSALTIQQQQEQALAELQALMQTQQVSSSIINASSSSFFSGASVSRNPQPRSSSDAASVSTTKSSHRVHDPASPPQLQRAPPASSDDDSDPEFSQFLNEFDNSNS